MLKAIFFCPISQVSQGFIQALNCLHLPEVKLNLKLSFETRSFKPKNKKVIKTVWTLGKSLIYSFFTFRSHQRCSKKNCSPGNETCVHRRRLSLPYLFWIKLPYWFSKLSTFEARPSALESTVNGGLEQKYKV